MTTTPTPVASLSQSTRPLRVVIIDDTFDLREVLRLALTRGGMEVVAEAEVLSEEDPATTGEVAIAVPDGMLSVHLR